MSKQEEQAHLISPPNIESNRHSAFFTEGEWPEKNWWEIFDYQELNQLIAQALEHNPSLQAVQEKVEFYQAQSIIKRSKLFPLISFDYNESWMFVSEDGITHRLNPSLSRNHNEVSLFLSLDYEFDFWGKYRNLFLAAVGKTRAEIAESYQVRLMVTSALAQGYFALKTNLLRQKYINGLVEAHQELLDLNILRVQSGLDSDFPLLSQEEALHEALEMLEQVNEEVEKNKHWINALIGCAPNDPLPIKSDGLIPLPPHLALPQDLTLDLLSRRPDLMAQIWRAEALSKEVGAAIADFFPNISLTGMLGTVSNGFTDLFKWSTREASLAPAIHLPIFTAGAIKANVESKKAEFNGAIFDYNQLLLKSAQEVADLMVVCDSVYKQRQHQDIVVANALKGFQLMEGNQQAGLSDDLSLLHQEIDWIQKELQSLQLIYMQYVASIKMIKSLGGGYTSECLPIRKEEAL